MRRSATKAGRPYFYFPLCCVTIHWARREAWTLGSGFAMQRQRLYGFCELFRGGNLL